MSNTLTGVQRYTSELLSRFGGRVSTLSPSAPLLGIKGHAWEQFVLPSLVGRNLLWSPSNTGPMLVRDQVISVHDVTYLDHPEWMSRKFARWYSIMVPRVMAGARAVITISEHSRQRIIDHCPAAKDKVHVTYLAADARFTRSRGDDIAAMRQALAIPTPHYFVALGSLEPRKNLKRLLEAWSSACDKLDKDIWLVLAGARGKALVFGGQSYDVLPPRVHLTGHVPDAMLPALYSGAITSLYPSLYEGFGLPPLEAMGCGTPVITSSATSLPEVVGDAALTVDPRDEQAIAAAIVRLADDSMLRRTLSERGLERFAKFSWDRTAAQTLAVLKEAACH